MRSWGYEFYLRNQIYVANDCKDHVWESVRKSLKTEALKTVTNIFSNFFWKFDFCYIDRLPGKETLLIPSFTGKLKPLETPFHLGNSRFSSLNFLWIFMFLKKNYQILTAKEYYFFSLFRSKIFHKVQLLLLVHCSTLTNIAAPICC